MGCYEDDGDRILPHEEINNNIAMTVDMCRNHCTQKGYSFYGLEDGQQCFCGNVIKSGYLKVSDNQCDRTCTGDPTKTCGGSWRIAIYQVV
ncbi:WSC domain-containing protein 2-like [Haliotis rubra]|uniref:WSC domain-containing protein 2-like n=1 Tax=Haliotis rubra TaxID=36100 RepID=UPI001EE5F093|nr:WSC domain-containing protein 2-like [Haliotis rubra]